MYIVAQFLSYYFCMKTRPYILIVDSEQEVSAKLADFLKSLNYQVEVAKTSKEGLDLYMASHYDVEVATPDMVYAFGDVTFDSVHQTLGTKRLSARESEVMLMLCRNKNRMVERTQILKNIWHDDSFFASRSLSVYVNHLRKYLEETQCPLQIMSVHGKGYKLVEI